MKNILKSRTVWLAVIQFLIGGFVALQTANPSLGWALVAKSVLDIILRVLTVEPVISSRR